MEQCKKPSVRIYVSNENFMKLLEEYNNQEAKPKIISEELGEIFILIVDNLANSRQFINYSDDWKAEMKSDALYNSIKYIDKFDITKYRNPFAYFTMIAFNSFRMRIKKEKTTMLKNDIIRNELFDEFLVESKLYERKTGQEMDDEDNRQFVEMDKMKIDLEDFEPVKCNLTEEDLKVD
jgi:hypothetical protein